MKKTLYSICLLLSAIASACTDNEELEEVKPKDLRLAKVTVVDSNKPAITASYTFSYNAQGNLSDYREVNSDFVANRTRSFIYTYDAQNKLIENNFMEVATKTKTLKEVFLYDNAGKLSSTARYYPTQASPVEIWFMVYDAQGRVTRINTYSDAYVEDGFIDGIVDFTTLEYDGRGNISREANYVIYPHSGDSQLFSEIIMTYDDKNPFHGLGTPSFIHGFKRDFLYSYESNWSSNNLLQSTLHIYGLNSVRTYSNTVSYKYNEQGYPVEITDKTVKHTLEYEAK